MPREFNPSLIELAANFFRLGLTAFGGPSMVVYIRKLVVEQKRWMDNETFNDGVALSQIIPGSTALQTAAYIGLKTRGIPGAIVSFCAFALPALMLMLGFAMLYSRSQSVPIVVLVFQGLRAIIVAIIANAAWAFAATAVKNWKTLALFCLSALLFAFKLNPIIVIIVAGASALLLAVPATNNSNEHAGLKLPKGYFKSLLIIAAMALLGFAWLYKARPLLFKLALVMFRIDLFAFGGGFASLPLMFHEIVEVRSWMDSQTFMNGIVLGQITPGPIILTATFIGYILHGWSGSLSATAGIFLPSFLLVIVLTPYFDHLKSSAGFNKFIAGVLCSFAGLLLVVAGRFALEVQWNLLYIILAVGAFAALRFKLDILWVVTAGTLISVGAYLYY